MKYAEYLTNEILNSPDGINVNMLASIRNYETGEELVQVGGIYSRYLGKYIPVAADPAVIWHLNKGQMKLFELLPQVLDKSIKNPVTEVIAYGGRRTGKTEGAVLMALALTLIYPRSVGALYGYDYESALNALDKIFRMVPDNWIVRWNQQKKILYFANGSEIRFKTAKAGKRAGRSFAFSWVILDEPSFYDNASQILTGVLPATIESHGAVFMITSPAGRDAVFWETEKSKDPDPEISESIRTIYFGSTFDNPFIDAKGIAKIKILAKTMSKTDYQQEILGEPANIDGLVLYDWHRVIHVKSSSLLGKDITQEVCLELFKVHAEWIFGMDFNESPMALSAWKLYDKGHLHCHLSVLQDNMNAMKFGQEVLLPFLRSQYPGIPDAELTKKCIIIGDATGQWKGVGEHDWKQLPSWSHLKTLGFTVLAPDDRVFYQPRAVKHGTKRNSNMNRIGSGGMNPRKIDRMEAVRSRLYDMEGHSYISVGADVSDVIKMAENLQLYHGQPDKFSEWEHLWDAWSYPIFKFFPRKTIDKTLHSGYIALVEKTIAKYSTP
jgi:hypothetical protein